MVIRTHDISSVGFDKIVGNDFEQWRFAALARRAEGRKPGVIPHSLRQLSRGFQLLFLLTIPGDILLPELK
jgi:hypothetical protein